MRKWDVVRLVMLAELAKCDQTTPNIMYTFIYYNKVTSTLNLMGTGL